jgi:PAS domain S-box-containing protein
LAPFLLLIAAAVIYVVAPGGIHRSDLVITTTNALFCVGIPLLVAYLVARGYVVIGLRFLLLFGSATVILAVSQFLMGIRPPDPNQALSATTFGLIGAGLVYTAAGAYALARGEQPRGSRYRLQIICGCYAAAAAATTLAFVLAGMGFTVTLTAGGGLTPIARGLLGVAAAEFAAASVLILLVSRASEARLSVWGSAGLALIAASIGITLLQGDPGSTMGWLGRGSQCLGSIFILIGVMVGVRQSGISDLQTERTLVELEGRYRNLVNLSPDAVVVHSHGRIVFANPAAVRLLAAPSLSDVMGLSVLDTIDPACREVVSRGIGRAYASGISPPHELTILRLDGSTVDVEVTRTKVQFDGKLGIQAVMRDISGRKRLDESLRAGQRTAEILDSIKGSLFALDREWKFTHVSSLFASQAGTPPEDLVGRDASELISGYIGVENMRELRTVMDGREFGRFEFKDKASGCWLAYAAFPSPEGITVVQSDISEQKRAESELRESEKRYRELAEENERLYQQQLVIADSLQRAFLDMPSEVGPVRLSHLYRSATEAARVGGDFYDVFGVKDGKVGVLIGDVSGHGVEAARVATLTKDVIHAFAHQTVRPEQILHRTNGLLLEKNLKSYVTLFLGILDVDSYVLHYSSAGHPEPFIRRRGGEIEVLGDGSAPLGIYPDNTWRRGETRIEVGDLLLLYTDGVTEARKNGDFFGDKRLRALLKRKRLGLERLPHVILDQVLAFSDGNLHDDIAVLVLGLDERTAVSAREPIGSTDSH